MSALRVGKELTPVRRPQFGGGDGLTNNRQIKPNNSSESKGYVKRTPIPSSRRFGTRGPIQSTTPIASVLQDAINVLEISTPKRRSQTMTDLSIPSKQPRARSSSSQGDKKTFKKFRIPPGRIVYQQILLNSWRRKKQEAASNSQIICNLQQQIDQLQLQNSTLHTLRDSESKRREEALCEKNNLQSQFEQLFKVNKLLIAERIEKDKQIEEYTETIQKLTMDKENIKNHLQSSIENTSAVERQLDRERMQVKKMREDNYALIEQLQCKDDELVLQSDKIRQLEDILLQTESSYNTVLMNYQTQELKLCELQDKVEELSKQCVQLEVDLQTTNREKQDQRACAQQLQTDLDELKLTCESLENDKQKLKQKLVKTKEILKKYKEKSWWKTTTEFVSLPLHAFNTIAHNLLPALQSSSSINDLSAS